MKYLYLALAIIGEVAGTSALKASDQFTKIVPSMVVILGYGMAFYFLSIVVKSIPLGISYAIWSGLGIVLVSIVGIFFYKHIPDLPRVIGMLLIILRVLVIHLFSETAKG